MRLNVPTLVVVPLVSVAAAAAQDKPSTPVPGPVAPLSVQVVLSRYQGDRKVASLPYTLSADIDGRTTRLRMGMQVPLLYEGKEVRGNVVYKTVGTSLDCTAEAVPDGRFRLVLGVEQSSVYIPGRGESAEDDDSSAHDNGSLTPPLLRTFSSEASLVLGHGQTAQYVAATDPVSGEVLKVDVTLHVVLR